MMRRCHYVLWICVFLLLCLDYACIGQSEGAKPEKSCPKVLKDVSDLQTDAHYSVLYRCTSVCGNGMEIPSASKRFFTFSIVSKCTSQ